MPKLKPDDETLQKLRRAIESDEPGLLEPFVKGGLSVEQKVGDGPKRTLLEFAIEKNAINVATFLIGAGAKIDTGPNRPLIYAALFNRPEMVELLLNAGANPNVTVSNPDENVHGETALMYAVDIPDKIRVVELLLKHSADPNLANSKGQTALYHAVDFANLEAVRRLLAAGAKTAGVVLHGLIYRCTSDSLEIFKILIAAGADLNAPGTRDSHFWGCTAASAAKGSCKEKAELIEQLSGRGREGWEEETLERWKAEARIFQAMIEELNRAEQSAGGP
jgi:ankyrin repeat protein